MKIENDSSPNAIKVVSFTRTLTSGRKKESYIEALESPFADEGPTIAISGINLMVQDVPEFIKAIKIAAMIASGELEIE